MSDNYTLMLEYQNNDISWIGYNDFEYVLEKVGYFTEAYHGKTDTLLSAEKCLADISKMLNKNPIADITNSVFNKELENLICKQFGFKAAYFYWNRTGQALTNAYSMISTDVIFDDSVITVNPRTGYYNKNHTHVLNCVFSVSLFTDLHLSPEEVMGILLHEIGHNFDVSPYYVMNTLFVLINTFNSAIRQIENGQIPAAVSTAIRTALSVTNPGHTLMGKVNKLWESVLSAVPVFKEFGHILTRFVDFCSRSIEKLFAIPGLILLPVEVLLSPLCHLVTVPSVKMEQFADSFATTYGYGVELASALTKMEKLNLMGTPRKLDKSHGFAKIISDFALAQRYLVSQFIDVGHGTNASRMHSIMKVIQRDINDADIAPESKKELMAQLNRLNASYKNYLGLTEDQKFAVTAATRKAIYNIFGDNSSYIAKLFPDNMAE